MNLLENIIQAISPAAALRREQARKHAALVRSYEAASRGGRAANWYASGTDANAENQFALTTIRNRARDLVRNNAYAAKAIDVLQNNAVGYGIRAGIRDSRAAAAWKQWAETTACDFDGVHDIYGLQALVMRTVAESGECIVLRRFVNRELKLQVLEPDHLDTSKTENTSTGAQIIQGVEFDTRGRRVAYWIFPEHPGGLSVMRSLTPERYPASGVLHIFERQRPGQIRGVPFGVSSFIRLRDFAQYEEAQLLRQKIASCYAVFVSDSTDSIASSTDDTIPDRVAPGTIERLPPGKSVSFATPPTVENYAEYSSVMLHAIAAGYGVPYEALTGDLSQVNFSSARLGWLEFQRRISALQWRLLIPQFCAPAFGWWANFAELQGVPVGVAANWTPPRREMIDPGKEIAAVENAVRAGFVTLPEAIKEFGYEPSEVFAEIASTNETLDNLGIKLTTDPRYFQQAGKQPQENSTNNLA